MINLTRLLLGSPLVATTTALLAMFSPLLFASNFETTESKFSAWGLVKNIHKMDYWGTASIYSESKELINGQKSLLGVNCNGYSIKISGPFKAFSAKAIKINGDIVGYTQQGRIKINNSAPKILKFRFETIDHYPITINKHSLFVATPKPMQWIKNHLISNDTVHFGVHLEDDPLETVLTFSLAGFNEALSACPKDLPDQPTIKHFLKPRQDTNQISQK